MSAIDVQNAKHCVYKHTLRNDGRVYIGQTLATDVRWSPDRYRNCKRFYNAILKYGWDAFEHEIIIDGLTQGEANVCEIALIFAYKSTDDRNGFNICAGGRGHKRNHSKETKLKLSLAGKKRKHSEETKAKMSHSHKGKHTGKDNPMYGMVGEKNHRWGKHLTDAEKKHLADLNYSRKSPCSKRVVCVETGTVYSCAMDIERLLGVNHTNIAACCRGKQKSALGYHWRYA